MPWVLSDYSSPTLDLAGGGAFRDLSRPVGALNPRRLQMLRERYRGAPGGAPGAQGLRLGAWRLGRMATAPSQVVQPWRSKPAAWRSG